MKIIALIPLKIVPPFTPFRFEKTWWRRMSGCSNYGRALKDDRVRKIEEHELVAVSKDKLTPNNYQHVIKWFKIT